MDSGTVDRDQIKNNGWRLGRCFDESSSPQLVELIPDSHKSDGVIFITATHDCSLIHPMLEREPYLEYLAATPIEKPNPQNTEAKDIRRLHLPIKVNGELLQYELQMAKRGFIDRSSIGQCLPCEQVSLPVGSRAILVRWLSNRYTTQTLPDAFDRRIKPMVEGKKKPLRKLLQKPEATHMLGIYVDLKPPHGDLGDEEDYQLTVLLLYKDKAFNGEFDLDEYADSIKNCLAKADGVDVQDVVPLSDKDISVNRLRRMRRWQIDFISFRDQSDDVALIEEGLS